MASEQATGGRTRSIVRTLADTARADGAVFALAAVTFFLGSAVLTQSGEPGASTPLPWMGSHVLWVAASVLASVGTILLVRRASELGSGVAEYLSVGAFALSVLHALQWAAWVYVDVIAYRHGGHELLFETLLHPFGTAHALLYGVLVGGGVACLGWGLNRAGVTHPAVGWTGVAVGTAAVSTATASLLTFAPVRSATSLATVGLIAVNYGWVLVLGVVLGRRGGVGTLLPRPDSER